MFFAELSEMETLMHGHGLAFLQLGLLADNSATFNQRFGAWLTTRKGISAAAGWAVALERLATEKSLDEIQLFFDVAEEFFDFWRSD